MGKTPEYTKKAVDNYRNKFDFIQVRFPKGTKDRLKRVKNANDYISYLVLSDLDRMESDQINQDQLRSIQELQPEIKTFNDLSDMQAVLNAKSQERELYKAMEPDAWRYGREKTAGEVLEEMQKTVEPAEPDELDIKLAAIRKECVERKKTREDGQ